MSKSGETCERGDEEGRRRGRYQVRLQAFERLDRLIYTRKYCCERSERG